MFRLINIIALLVFTLSCDNQTIYSGKLLNQENLQDLKFKNKDNLINNFGLPSYNDEILNKYFYFSEKKTKRSVFNKKIDYSYIFVFEFDSKDEIVSTKVYDLKNQQNFNFIEDETEDIIIKRGLIEKVFGGVGPQTELPTTP